MRGSRRAKWVFGRHVVEESLNSKTIRVQQVLLLEDDRRQLKEFERRVRRSGAKVRWVGRKELDRAAAGARHQGMAAQITEKAGAGFAGWLEGLSAGGKKSALVVVLDEIQDPHNFGAIVRSAACLGASAVLHTEHRSAPVTQVVMAASAGAVGRISIFPAGNLSQTLEKLKKAGFWVYGADRSGQALWKTRLNRPTVLVIGSEGKGIRPLVRRNCDGLVSIPQAKGGVESLNASCAAAVVLYEAARQLATSSS